MPQFEYYIERSSADDCQVDGIKCHWYSAQGDMTANSIYAVRDFCVKLMGIPGVYRVAIRNTAPDCEWKEFDAVDTRNPEAAAVAVSKAKKKARRAKKVNSKSNSKDDLPPTPPEGYFAEWCASRGGWCFVEHIPYPRRASKEGQKYIKVYSDVSPRID